MQPQVLFKRKEINQKEYRRNRMISWFYAISGAAVIMAVLFGFMFKSVGVSGEAMLPALAKGDIVLVDRLAFYIRSVQRGDMVEFLHPESGASLIRRVVALEGESVLLQYGNVYINGIWLNEYSYCAQLYGDMEPVEVPKGYVFVLCDNRQLGPDSRSPEIGLIPISKLIGKLRFRISPFPEIAVFS